MDVQKKIIAKKKAIRELAKSFRDNPEETKWLIQLLDKNRIDIKSGILVYLVEILDQGPVLDCTAIWLTKEKHFIELYGEADSKTKELLLETCKPQNLTRSLEIVNNKRGIGKTFGALTLEVIDEIISKK